MPEERLSFLVSLKIKATPVTTTAVPTAIKVHREILELSLGELLALFWA
ncbi:MAG: hypothetical protein KDC45_11470 [Bacteroidetes bacterium]|nr:hypothetical protein [Bacteroidota bacterium]